jgi:hypothetical protein
LRRNSTRERICNLNAEVEKWARAYGRGVSKPSEKIGKGEGREGTRDPMTSGKTRKNIV